MAADAPGAHGGREVDARGRRRRARLRRTTTPTSVVTKLRFANVLGRKRRDARSHGCCSCPSSPRSGASTPGCSSCTRTTSSARSPSRRCTTCPASSTSPATACSRGVRSAASRASAGYRCRRSSRTGPSSRCALLRIVDLPPELLALLRYGRGVDTSRWRNAGYRYRHTTLGDGDRVRRGDAPREHASAAGRSTATSATSRRSSGTPRPSCAPGPATVPTTAPARRCRCSGAPRSRRAPHPRRSRAPQRADRGARRRDRRRGRRVRGRRRGRGDRRDGRPAGVLLRRRRVGPRRDERGPGEDPGAVRGIYDGFLSVRDCTLPTVAAVNGPAVGAGFNLALCCDVRIVGESARFDSRFARIGLHPGRRPRVDARPCCRARRPRRRWTCSASASTAPEPRSSGSRGAASPTTTLARRRRSRSRPQAAELPRDLARSIKATLREAPWQPELRHRARDRARSPDAGPSPRAAARRSAQRLTRRRLEDLVLAHGPLLGGDRVADVVLPHATDLEEPLRRPLVAHAELLGDTPAARVARDDRRLDPVQAELLERVTQDHGHGLGHVALARVAPRRSSSRRSPTGTDRAARCRGSPRR